MAIRILDKEAKVIVTNSFIPRLDALSISSRPRGLGWRTAGCLLALLAVTAGGCKSDPPVSANRNQASNHTNAPRPVKTVRVTQIPMEQSVTVTGALAAYDQATLSAKVPGRLGVIAVDLGSKVRQGEMVAQLEPQDYQLRLQQAEAALAQARARLGLSPEGSDDRVNLEQTGTVRQALAVMEEARANRDRVDALFREHIISRAQLDAAEANYKVALSRYQDAVEEIRNRQALLAQRRSELALASQQLTDTAINAPFEGIIQEKKATLGEYLAAGAPVVMVVRMNPLRLRAEVPERAAPSIRAGQITRVTVEGDPRIYTGQIKRLSPAITERNRMLLVEADVTNNGSLRPGSFVRADIVTDSNTKATVVPTRAIVSFAGIKKVIAVQHDKAAERPITTGRSTPEWTEVTSGVALGDEIVVDPGNLQSGQAVTVIP